MTKETNMTTTETMAVHSAATLFPMMGDAEFQQFKKDIAEKGLLQPIAVLPSGELLDGRNRLKACRELGIEPKFTTVTVEDPVAYVLSLNLSRRHLSAAQRAAIAVKAMPLLRAQAREKQRQGGASAGRGRPQQVAPKSAPPIDDRRSRGDARREAAKLTGACNQYIAIAQKLADRDPDLFQQVEKGETSIDVAARISSERHKDEPPKSQPRVRAPRPSVATGKRAAIQANFAFSKASEFVARIEGVADVCNKVSVEAISSDERLLRHWIESCKDAIKALRDMLRRLEEV